MKKYRFIINDVEKMTIHLREMVNRGVTVCIKDVLDSGYFDTYLMDSHKPEQFAELIGSKEWKEIQ